MNQAGDERVQDEPLYGDALLASLRKGWSPIPSKTVMALVFSGLRVRIMRSVVTMVSIVLAIAFLGYTGLSNQLYQKLAHEVQRLEATEQLPAEQINEAVGELSDRDLVMAVTAEGKIELAIRLGMADVARQVAARNKLKAKHRAAQLQLELATVELEALRGKADIAPAVAEGAAARVDQAKSRFVKLDELMTALERQIKLAEQLVAGRVDDVAAFDVAMRARQMSLVDKAGRLAKLDSDELAGLTALARFGESAVLLDALERQQMRRAGDDIRGMLRHAGVSVKKTLEGNPMDYWLIVMALLTCMVGIANAMLMSVTERFREIGTMKCLGAQDGLVVKLFLLESGFLGVVGAAVGIVMGLLVSFIGAVLQFGRYGLGAFDFGGVAVVLMWSVLAGVLLSVIGAVGPAISAARMQPVNALRVEE